MDGFDALALAVALVVGGHESNEPLVDEDASVAAAIVAILAQDGRHLRASGRRAGREVHQREEALLEPAHALHVRLDGLLAPRLAVHSKSPA